MSGNRIQIPQQQYQVQPTVKQIALAQFEMQKEGVRAWVEDGEMINLNAQLIRKKYEALLAVGFNEAEALRIAAREG